MGRKRRESESGREAEGERNKKKEINKKRERQRVRLMSAQRRSSAASVYRTCFKVTRKVQRLSVWTASVPQTLAQFQIVSDVLIKSKLINYTSHD